MLFGSRLREMDISSSVTTQMIESTDSFNVSPSFAPLIFRLSANLIFRQRQTFHSHVHDTYLFLKCC